VAGRAAAAGAGRPRYELAYDAGRLRGAVSAAAKPGGKPIAFLIKNGVHYRAVTVDYHGGLRYPHP
jgi:hypothetical protein